MSDTKPEETGENLDTGSAKVEPEANLEAAQPGEGSSPEETGEKPAAPKRRPRKATEKPAEPQEQADKAAPETREDADADKPEPAVNEESAEKPPEQEKPSGEESPEPPSQEKAKDQPAEAKEAQEQPEEKKPARRSQTIVVNNLIKLTHDQILKRLNKLDAKVNPNRSKVQLMLEILRRSFALGDRLEAAGIFTYNSSDGSGVLLFEEQNFSPSALDIYVSQNFIQRYKLKPGVKIYARLHAPKEKDKRIALDQILEIEDRPLEEWKEVKPFDQLTPLFPKERIILETKDEEIVDGRVIDLIAPLGKGQRGLIIAPPRVGKTILLKHIAQSITQNHPEIELLILLVDERPEEVTDMKREVKATVYSSTFDEGNHRHIQIAELVQERAKRLVEQGKDVVILLDSLTRLARGYNNQTGNKGRLLSGGIDPKALQKAGRFFSVARNAEEGGSLTLLASVLVDTGSKLDQVIYEEFKGKGNMDILLDRMLVEKRIFPGIHIVQSGTRKEDFLYHPDELQGVQLIRKQLAAVPVIEAMETLLKNIHKTSTNAELILRGLR